MKGFALDERGDIVISNGDIQMAHSDELISQRVRTVLGTNQGEWFFDLSQGIAFANVLGKGVTSERMRYEVARGLAQVDDFTVTDFSYEVRSREAHARFTARTRDGAEVRGDYSWV